MGERRTEENRGEDREKVLAGCLRTGVDGSSGRQGKAADAGVTREQRHAYMYVVVVVADGRPRAEGACVVLFRGGPVLFVRVLFIFEAVFRRACESVSFDMDVSLGRQGGRRRRRRREGEGEVEC